MKNSLVQLNSILAEQKKESVNSKIDEYQLCNPNKRKKKLLPKITAKTREIKRKKKECSCKEQSVHFLILKPPHVVLLPSSPILTTQF